ncbi:MAG: cupredoxin domain-containing protein [candidate division KSB1 bacterium]|nr:cupredoxin domain-containing protein [candidate division KSB1 bacterium]MDZ7364549.1 cupredoxin domain-containing protein [candidate division KSB1 bacterium]MDZ7405748.1 cupredoxin domain-containing protein [candidate division KSB1 bacterium]
MKTNITSRTSRTQTGKSLWYPDFTNRPEQKFNGLNPGDSTNLDTTKNFCFLGKESIYNRLHLPFVLLLMILACGTPGKKLAPTTVIAKVAKGDTLQAEVTLRNFYFDPSRIETEVNKPLRLTLKKRSGFLDIVPHDFNLIAPDADLEVAAQKVPSGDGVTITITPTKVGEYQFFCGKHGHAKKGMVGFLIVREHL